MKALACDLRQGIGVEWRAEGEATEVEVQQQRLRGRTLVDIADVLLHRGVLVTVQTGGLQITGELVGCGQDCLTVHTDHVGVDARLDSVSLVVGKPKKRRRRGPWNGPHLVGAAYRFGTHPTSAGIVGPVIVWSPVGAEFERCRRTILWLVEPTGADVYLRIEQVTAAVRRVPS